MKQRKVRRVVRTPPRPRRTTPSKRPTVKRKTVQKSTPSIRFSLIPEAHAVGPALGTVIKGGLRVATKLKPIKGRKSLRPARDKTIKSVTYKNLIEGPLMKKTGGGVPLYKGYPKTFGIMQSGKVDTRLLDLAGIKGTNVGAATRANQAMIGTSSVKHTVKKKSFKKIIPGGPIMEFPGGVITRYRKRELKTVKTKGTLIQGQDPTTPKLGLDKFLAAPAAAATVPFWDQIGNFFNPLPEAHAALGIPQIAKQIARLTKEIAIEPNAMTKVRLKDELRVAKVELFDAKVQLKNIKGKKQITVSPPTGPTGAGKAGKISRKKTWGLMGGAMATGLGGTALITSPEVQGWLQGSMGSSYVGPVAPVAPGTDQPHTTPQDQEFQPTGGDQTAVAPIIPYGTEGGQSMQEAQSTYEAGLIAAAAAPGPAPGIRYGLPGEKGMANKAYTNVTYKKWDGKNFVEATQWVKLGMTGMTATGVSEILTRQATRDQVNTVHASVQAAIQKKYTAAKTNKLLAAAETAETQYAGSVTVGGTEVKVSTILGPLPRQYQTILDERG